MLSCQANCVIPGWRLHCNAQGWSPLSRKRFESQLGPLMMEMHRAARRNDIERGSSQKRGFMGVRLQEIQDDKEVAE